MWLRCIECNATYDIDESIYSCRRCGELLEVKLDLSKISSDIVSRSWSNRPLSVWRYSELLPVVDKTRVVSLFEGGTGLHGCTKLSALLGIRRLLVKNEGENPTGSFKDRGMTVGVTKAVERGVKSVICASTGNTSASLSAYAAKAGLKRIVLIPSGKIAFGKLAQAVIYGARVVQVKGNFDKALEIVMELCRRNPETYILNSVNPFRIEGQKTLAYEICEQLGRAPDCVVMPVGNAGNISAAWKGFNEFYDLGLIKSLPRMIGVQAEGASPISEAVKKGAKTIRRDPRPETIATAIRIGSPISWKKALDSIYSSRGTAETVSDEEILDAQRLIARLEGLFIEPASAAPIAALKKLLTRGELKEDDVVVSVATGHGLKDPDIIGLHYEKPIEVEADLESIEGILELKRESVIVA